MKRSDLLAALAAVFVVTVFISATASAQSGRTTEKEVMTQPVTPAPENGDIIVRFGETVLIYFRLPVKTVRLDDEYSVKAVPQSDHIISFSGLAPGHSTLTVESVNGTSSSWGLVTVVRDPHEVRVYTPHKVNPVSGENRQSAINSAGYFSMYCNEVSCAPVPGEK